MESRSSRKTFQSRLDDLVNSLREEIVSGQRQPGEFLPSERDLTNKYSLSNLSVRKGLELLVAEGLIDKIPRVGNKVIGPPSPDGPVQLSFGYYTSIPRETDIDRLLERFHELNPHIQVQAVPITNENPEVVKQFLDNGMLDVLTLNYEHYRSYIERGYLNRLEPLQTNPDLYPYLTKAFATHGKQFVLPFIFSPVILCYNRQHFLERNVHEPDSGWDWDQLFETARKLAIPGERLGFYYHFLSSNRWSVFLLQMGGAFRRDADNRVQLYDTPMMDAFRFCRKVQEHFPILSENIMIGESEQLFMQGKVSMIMTSYFHLNFMKGSDVPFDIAPVPYVGEPRTLLMSIGLAVNRNSRHKEAAQKLVRYLTSYEAQLHIRKTTYSLPAHKPAAECAGVEIHNRPTRFSMFREIIPTYRYFTDLNIGNKELLTLEREVKLYWAGLESEETFCSRIEQLLSAK